MTVKKPDLKPLYFVATPTITSQGLEGSGASAEAVPENMKRYVYYAKYVNLHGSEVILSLFESIAGVLKVIDQQKLNEHQTLVLPRGTPDPEKPIQAYRSSGYIRSQTSRSLGSGWIGVTMMLYDEPG